MIRKAFILVISSILFLRIFALETKITGNIQGGSGKEIRLITFSDQISHQKLILDRTRIDSLGLFSLKADINEVILSYLDTDYSTATLFLEPGKNYNIIIDTLKNVNQYRPFYEKDQMNFSIVPYNPSELNYLISEFNIIYNDFISENFELIYKRRKTGLIGSFLQQMSLKYSETDNDFFRNYVTYKIASFELSSTSTGQFEIFNKYLKSKQVLYNHPEYMFFFNTFFDQYLTRRSRQLKYTELIKIINGQNSYPAMLDFLGKDSLLINERLRELVLLIGLNELYDNPDFIGENILNILTQMFSASSYFEHRRIAKTLISSLTALKKGTPAPSFRLPNLDGDSLALSNFYGEPIYLGFLTTWSYACLGEFKLMDSLYLKYGRNINFITVSFDDNNAVVKRFVKDKNYNWTFLYNGTGYDLIQLYGIKTFPLFVLINSEGMISQYPADKPSEGIEDTFELWLKK